MLIEFLSDVEGSLAKARPQEETGATKAPKVKPLMGIIDWRKSVIQVNLIFVSATVLTTRRYP